MTNEMGKPDMACTRSFRQRSASSGGSLSNHSAPCFLQHQSTAMSKRRQTGQKDLLLPLTLACSNVFIEYQTGAGATWVYNHLSAQVLV